MARHALTLAVTAIVVALVATSLAVVALASADSAAPEICLTPDCGLVGPPGADGQDGECGTDGATGPEGQCGPVGPPGADGQDGEPGACGPEGPEGPEGPAGLQGPQGACGPEGLEGPMGPRGLQGLVGPPGPVGAQGPQGPAGGFGAYGSFFDNQDLVIGTTATPVRLNQTLSAQGISIVGAGQYEIQFDQAGTYNIAFSSQLLNQANQERVVAIWLSKNGTTSDKWVSETTTDIVLGSKPTEERSVAAWNFFVSASAGDRYILMIATNSLGPTIHGGPSLLTGLGLPQIPSTIVTVNQVG